MTEKTLISPSGKTLLHVATRQTTPVSDARVKDVRLASAKERRLEENRKYLKNQNVEAFLAAISKAEGGDYNLMYGGVVGKKNDKWRFNDFSTHPGPRSDGRTTAAGRYQINKANWQENGVKKMGLSDFSPETQDLIAVESIRQVHALENVIEGDIDSATRKQWRPQKTMRTTEHFAVDKALLKQHIVEVEVCTVDSFCIFRYVKNGKCLKLVAHGEDLNGLTVSTWDNSCPEQAMTK